MEEKQRHMLIVTGLEFPYTHGVIRGIIYMVIHDKITCYKDRKYNRRVFDFECTKEQLEQIKTELDDQLKDKKFVAYKV